MGIVLGVAVPLDTAPIRLLLLRLTGRAAWGLPGLAAPHPAHCPLQPLRPGEPL
jgi:hypothetical protein